MVDIGEFEEMTEDLICTAVKLKTQLNELNSEYEKNQDAVIAEYERKGELYRLTTRFEEIMTDLAG